MLAAAPAISRYDVTALLLAGGEGSRMGGQDKGWVTVAGRPLVEYVLEVVAPQVGEVVISANRNLERYAAFGWPAVSDEEAGYRGPMAGIVSAARLVVTPYLLTVPCDTPLLPPDLLARLAAALASGAAEVAVAHDGARRQPVVALLRRELTEAMRTALEAGEGGLGRFYAERHCAVADFSDRAAAFVNVNSPAECAEVAALFS